MGTIILLASIISTLHVEGDVTAPNGNYVVVPFAVPTGTVEFDIARTVTPTDTNVAILDFGVWEPAGQRGWGGGLKEMTTIGVADSSRGYLPGPISPTTWQLVVGKAKIPAGSSVHYTADFTFRDAATLVPRTRAEYQPTVLKKGVGWYKGDLHVHDNESGDSTATFAEVIALAKSRQLDFIVLSDHNTVSQHALIAQLQLTLPDLLLVRGAEMTTYGGHGGSLGAPNYVDHRVGLNGRDITGIIHDVNAQGGLFIVNHPSADLGTLCIGCQWSYTAITPWKEVSGIEVLTSNYTANIALFISSTLKLWDEQLDAGAHIAAVGGSDDHSAGTGTGITASPIGSPTTRVYATELSEAAILDAIRNEHTEVALSGPTNPLVELSTDSGAHRIGDTATGSEVEITAHVVGGNGDDLQLVQDGMAVTHAFVDSDDWTHSFSVTVPKAGSRVRAHLLVEDGDPIVITSHLWLTYAAPANSGGCSIGSSAPSVVLPLFVFVALYLVARRRRAYARSSNLNRYL